jgi:flagellar biosynthetic protein FliP
MTAERPLLARFIAIHTVCFLVILAVFAAVSRGASAQDLTFSLDPGASVTERAVQIIALITVLSLAPSILVMVTSFTRIVVVLSLLRTAMGVQQSPPNSVILSLALFLTAFVMAPTFREAYEAGITPLINEQVELEEAFDLTAGPFRTFMLANVREKDLAMFVELSETERPQDTADISLTVLVPSFMISELRRAFEIGFLLFVPFVVIDMVVASVLMSMGMMMLPPIIISLPFKLVFFVLVDGWYLVTGSLIKSFASG